LPLIAAGLVVSDGTVGVAPHPTQQRRHTSQPSYPENRRDPHKPPTLRHTRGHNKDFASKRESLPVSRNPPKKALLSTHPKQFFVIKTN
jgi:hypothetical protein